MLDVKALLMKILDALKADYVVEQGTDGIWTYRKWNSGIAECWGKAYWTVTSWTAWGSVYESNYTTVQYPTGLFVELPHSFPVHTSSGINNTACIGLEIWGEGTKDKTPRISLIRPVSSGATNVNYYCEIFAKGTWK